MAKKNFTGGLDSLLGDSNKKETKKEQKVKPKERKDIRATFIIDEEINEKLKAIAFFERENIKVCLDKAVRNFIKSYEKANGSKYIEVYNDKKRQVA